MEQQQLDNEYTAAVSDQYSLNVDYDKREAYYLGDDDAQPLDFN